MLILTTLSKRGSGFDSLLSTALAGMAIVDLLRLFYVVIKLLPFYVVLLALDARKGLGSR